MITRVLPIIGCAFMVVSSSGLLARDFNAGGPVSNGIADAFANADEARLSKVWSGQIFKIDRSNLTREQLASSEAFALMRGCDLFAKQDNLSERYKASVVWHCATGENSEKPCHYRSVSADIWTWPAYDKTDALYLVEYDEYDEKKCGVSSAPRVALPKTDIQ